MSDLFRHYKGGRYRLLFIAATHQHNGDQDVVYLSLTTGTITTRPLDQDSRKDDAWNDVVCWPDGINRRRFMPDSRIFAEDLAALQRIWKDGDGSARTG